MLILNLQFYSGDQQQAMELARLIADMEVEKRYDVTFLFSARFDATHDQATIDYVSNKFPVRFITCTNRKGTGWPAGPNDLFSDSYQECIKMVRDGTIKDRTAVLFMEADCVPLSSDWISRLIEEYKGCGKKVLGAWISYDQCGIEHINGNCIISLDFYKTYRQIFQCRSREAWDATHRFALMAQGAPSRLIWSDYHLNTDRNPWKGEKYLFEPKRYSTMDAKLYGEELRPVWMHGLKGLVGIEAVRKKFKLPRK